ncbi:MAG: hypothetical protein LWW94_04040 [Candidatus Desulfofervidaceae bacterium]|nr:hypothetical protein [Candidatus Desulfofervidaceae bacterium]
MKLKTEFIKELVEKSNPVPIVGRELLELWLNLAIQENNLSDYYYKGEEKAKAFEELILKSYFEFYTLLAKICLKENTVFQIFSDSCFIVMDGMSFRESALLYKSLKKKGFKVTHSFNYSSIPSDTEMFREKMGIPINRFIQINNPDNIRLSGNEKYIWSYFPDVMLDKIKTGHTVISSLEEMYSVVEKIVIEVITQLKFNKIIITSDHGYIRTEAGYVFSVHEKAKKKFQNVFGGKRYVKMDSLNVEDLFQAGYVEEFNGYYIAKSRYLWPVSGKYSIYIHGGLSLMECLVPILEVER